jgi:hypothetical protein
MATTSPAFSRSAASEMLVQGGNFIAFPKIENGWLFCHPLNIVVMFAGRKP